MSSEKPDQIQASVAAALSRLRGDLGPTGATAPKIDEPPMGGAGDRPRPANDVRGDPFFRSIQTPPPGTGMAGRGAIPMTPFPRMQAPQEPPAQEPQEPLLSDDPKDEETGLEPAATIEIPDMPERDETPEQVSMPEPPSMSEAAALPQDEAAPQPTPEAQSAAAAAAAAANPLARMMRGPGQPGAAAPAQRDLLADLPPPPISGPFTVADTEPSATRRRRRNRRLLAAAAVVIVVVLGAWLWTKGEPSTEIPVITADATPEKVKPAEEGGLQVQNQDVQVLDPSTQTQAETVMPEPEQPITPPAATDAPAAEQAPTVVENTESNAAPTAEAPAADVAPSPDVPLAETPLPAMEENGTTEAAPAAPAAAAPEQTQTAETPAATEQAPATTAETTPAPAATPEPAPKPPPSPSRRRPRSQNSRRRPLSPSSRPRRKRRRSRPRSRRWRRPATPACSWPPASRRPRCRRNGLRCRRRTPISLARSASTSSASTRAPRASSIACRQGRWPTRMRRKSCAPA